MLFFALTTLAHPPITGVVPPKTWEEQEDLCDITGHHWRNSCDDLESLEVYAILGKLHEGQITCLEQRADQGPDAEASTRLLFKDAFAKGRQSQMAGYARQIVTRGWGTWRDYERAAQLHRSSDPLEALGWSAHALENAPADRREGLLELRVVGAIELLKHMRDDARASRRERQARIDDAESLLEGTVSAWLAAGPPASSLQRVASRIEQVGMSIWFAQQVSGAR